MNNLLGTELSELGINSLSASFGMVVKPCAVVVTLLVEFASGT